MSKPDNKELNSMIDNILKKRTPTAPYIIYIEEDGSYSLEDDLLILLGEDIDNYSELEGKSYLDGANRTAPSDSKVIRELIAKETFTVNGEEIKIIPIDKRE